MRDAFIQWALGLIFGIVGGAFGTFLVFRGRLDMMGRDIADERAARERLEASMGDKLTMLERRSILILKIAVDIARQVKVDNREFDDALIRMMTSLEDSQ